MYISCNQEDKIKPNTEVLSEERNSGAGTFCRPAGNQVNCISYSRMNVPVAYQGCALSVNFNVQRCIPLKFTFSDFTINWPIPLTSGCIALQQDWDANLLVNDFAGYFTKYNAFYKSITEQAEIWELTLNSSLIPTCGNGTVAAVDFLESGCRKVCSDGEGGFIQVLCGNGCCLRRSSYCKDTKGNIVRTGSVQVTQLTPCDPLANECGDNGSACNPACQRLQ